LAGFGRAAPPSVLIPSASARPGVSYGGGVVDSTGAGSGLPSSTVPGRMLRSALSATCGRRAG